jgi:histone deacetylase 6
VPIKHAFFPVLTMEDIQADEDYYDSLSLYVCPGTFAAARYSCGSVIEAALSVARRDVGRSFAIVRPPGHHAEPDEHMGFCFFNNVAAAAKVVLQRTSVKRILIVDWCVPRSHSYLMIIERLGCRDIHHGKYDPI